MLPPPPPLFPGIFKRLLSAFSRVSSPSASSSPSFSWAGGRADLLLWMIMPWQNLRAKKRERAKEGREVGEKTDLRRRRRRRHHPLSLFSTLCQAEVNICLGGLSRARVAVLLTWQGGDGGEGSIPFLSQKHLESLRARNSRFMPFVPAFSGSFVLFAELLEARALSLSRALASRTRQKV